MPEPFFIVCAPRSGSTLLRNLLRHHPNLGCPEETHFYRWADPFGTRAYQQICTNQKVLRYHRELDGISEQEFAAIFAASTSRRELQQNYATAYLQKNQLSDGIWFDKTPQNIQGILRIRNDFPASSIVHIIRHPLNVISSIMQGRSVGPESLLGALNTWIEAVTAASMARSLGEDMIITLRYEDLTARPHETIAELLQKLDLPALESFPDIVVSAQNSRYRDFLNTQQIEFILDACADHLNEHGYPANRQALAEWNALPAG